MVWCPILISNNLKTESSQQGWFAFGRKLDTKFLNILKFPILRICQVFIFAHKHFKISILVYMLNFNLRSSFRYNTFQIRSIDIDIDDITRALKCISRKKPSQSYPTSKLKLIEGIIKALKKFLREENFSLSSNIKSRFFHKISTATALWAFNLRLHTSNYFFFININRAPQLLHA